MDNKRMPSNRFSIIATNISNGPSNLERNSNSVSSTHDTKEMQNTVDNENTSSGGRFRMLDPQYSPRDRDKMPNLELQDLDIARTHSEEETPTPKLSKVGDVESIRHSDTGLNLLDPSQLQFNLITRSYPTVGAPTIVGNHHSSVNRFLINQFDKDEDNRMFSRAESMPIILPQGDIPANMVNYYNDYVRVEQLSENSSFNYGDDNQHPQNLDNLDLFQHTLEQLPNAMMSNTGGYPLTEISSDGNDQPEENRRFERFESQTADGIIEKLPHFTSAKLEKHELNLPPLDELGAIDFNNASGCRSHPPPQTSEIINKMLSQNESGNIRRDNFTKQSKNDSKSFEKKIPRQNSNLYNFELKSSTQPINTKNLTHYDEGFMNLITSPNSHPLNILDKSNSLMNEGYKERNKNGNMGSDEINLFDNRHNVSDPSKRLHSIPPNEYNEDREGMKYDQSHSIEHTLQSKGFDREHPMKDKSDDEKTPKGAYPEYRMNRSNVPAHDMDHPKSLFADQPPIEESTPGLTPLIARGALEETAEREEVPVNKKTGRFEESFYGGKNNYSQMPDRMNYDNFDDDDDTGGVSPHDRFFKSNIGAGRSGNMLELLNTNNQISVPLLERNESENHNEVFNNGLSNRNISDTRTMYKRDSRTKRLERTPTHVLKDSHRLDFHGLTSINNLRESEEMVNSPYIQKTNKVDPYLEQSDNAFEDEKLSQGLENRTQNSGRDIPRIRGGAVTQGFITNDRRRKIDQRRANKETAEQNERNNAPPYPRHPPVQEEFPTHGRYDNMHRNPPFAYQPQFEGQNEMPLPKEDYETNHPMSLARHNMNPMSMGYGPPPDIRNNDQMRVMTEIMGSMMSFQHNNFKTMIDSHTQLMDKMIDKMCSKNKKRYHSESSYHEDHHDKDYPSG